MSRDITKTMVGLLALIEANDNHLVVERFTALKTNGNLVNFHTSASLIGRGWMTMDRNGNSSAPILSLTKKGEKALKKYRYKLDEKANAVSIETTDSAICPYDENHALMLKLGELKSKAEETILGLDLIQKVVTITQYFDMKNNTWQRVFHGEKGSQHPLFYRFIQDAGAYRTTYVVNAVRTDVFHFEVNTATSNTISFHEGDWIEHVEEDYQKALVIKEKREADAERVELLGQIENSCL